MSLRLGTAASPVTRALPAWGLVLAVTGWVVCAPGVARAEVPPVDTSAHGHFVMIGRPGLLVGAGADGAAWSGRCIPSSEVRNFATYTKGSGVALFERHPACVSGREHSARSELIELLCLSCLLAVLLIPALLGRSSSPPGPSDSGSDDGWGKGRRGPFTPPNAPRGGLPIPDAEPARVRLRDHDRLTGPAVRERRPAREPAPARKPVRSGLV